jgi:hypothetical protein
MHRGMYVYVASAQRPNQHERPVAQTRNDAEECATLAFRTLAHAIVWDGVMGGEMNRRGSSYPIGGIAGQGANP